jgi:hypothetical protein
MKTLIRLRTLSAPLLLIIVLLTFVGAGTVQAAPTSRATYRAASWRIVPSPNLVASSTVLNSVAAFSSRDIWAVGQGSLIEHWNGISWHIVSPPSSGGDTFNAVATIPGTHQLWAVGSQGAALWNGIKWRSVPTPILDSSVLFGVVALSSADAWAVGQYYQGPQMPDAALIEHWNGTKWTQVAVAYPSGYQYSYLYSVTAFSATNVWAVGSDSNMAAGHTLVEHWNGWRWSIVPSPGPGPNNNVLLSVTTIPYTNHLWAVGYQFNGVQPESLVEYWNGSVWSVVQIPLVGVGVVSPFNGAGVIALSPRNAWIVGSSTRAQGDEETLIEHWDGSAWNVVASPNPATISFLSGLTKVPGSGALWAVGGYYNSQNVELTLTEQYS